MFLSLPRAQANGTYESATEGSEFPSFYCFMLQFFEKRLAIAWIPCYHVTIMIRSFKNAGTEDVFNGESTTQARRTCPQQLWRVAARKLDQLDSVSSLEELRIPPGNQLEALKGERKGQYSIRINDQYRICFSWVEGEPDEVEIVDYH